MGKVADKDIYKNKTGPTTGPGLNGLSKNQGAVREGVGMLPPKEVTILDGAISDFEEAALIVDTEGGGVADDLEVISDVISTTEKLHPGMLITLRAKDPARIVTIKNSVSPNGINTSDGNDIVLSPDWELPLRLVGGRWYEVRGRSSALAVEAQNAADNALAAAALAQSTATTAKAVTDKVTLTPTANAVPKADGSGKIAAGWVTGSMYCNKRMIITTSGNFIAPVKDWYCVICIGAGGQGGGRNATRGGAQGGSTSFGSFLSARGGSGGGAGFAYSGAGGGEEGELTVAFVHLEAGQSIPVTIGAGSSATSGTADGAGPMPGLGGNTNLAGGGAAGAGTGCSGINTNSYGAVGGAGGQGHFGFGGGGGGTGGGGTILGQGGTPGFRGVRPASTSDIGGAGGQGAIIIEYYDPSLAA